MPLMQHAPTAQHAQSEPHALPAPCRCPDHPPQRRHRRPFGLPHPLPQAPPHLQRRRCCGRLLAYLLDLYGAAVLQVAQRARHQVLHGRVLQQRQCTLFGKTARVAAPQLAQRNRHEDRWHGRPMKAALAT